MEPQSTQSNRRLYRYKQTTVILLEYLEYFSVLSVVKVF